MDFISDDKMLAAVEPVNPIQLSWEKLLVQGTACKLYRQQFAFRAGGFVWIWQLEGWVVVGYEQSCCPTNGGRGCCESPMAAPHDHCISTKSGIWKFRDVIPKTVLKGNFEKLRHVNPKSKLEIWYYPQKRWFASGVNVWYGAWSK